MDDNTKQSDQVVGSGNPTGLSGDVSSGAQVSSQGSSVPSDPTPAPVNSGDGGQSFVGSQNDQQPSVSAQNTPMDAGVAPQSPPPSGVSVPSEPVQVEPQPVQESVQPDMSNPASNASGATAGSGGMAGETVVNPSENPSGGDTNTSSS